MTCIVGIKTVNNVYIGGDSLGADAKFNCVVRKDPKVIRNGDFIIGYTTSFRMGQILGYTFKPPRHPKGLKTYIYMVNHFIPELIKCFEDSKYLRSRTNSQAEGGCFLVGYNNELFEIEDDFQVGIPACGYSAVGCGDAYAKGSLYESQDSKNSLHTRLIRALEAAEEFSCGVRGPFTILSLK